MTPSVASKGVIGAHVIPRLDLGVSGLAGLASATVFLTADASATMTLSLDASAAAAVNTTEPASASASVNGCIDVGAGLDVNAGASADFFGLFDPNTKVNLFSKKFDLFKKCLGASTTKREVQVVRSQIETSLTRRADLGCPAAIADLFKAVDEAIPAARCVFFLNTSFRCLFSFPLPASPRFKRLSLSSFHFGRVYWFGAMVNCHPRLPLVNTYTIIVY